MAPSVFRSLWTAYEESPPVHDLNAWLVMALQKRWRWFFQSASEPGRNNRAFFSHLLQSFKSGESPFPWGSWVRQAKSSGKYYKEELLGHEIMPPLSPPSFLQSKSAANYSTYFSSGRTRVGLLHRIHNYFVQRKMLRRPRFRLTHAGKVRDEFSWDILAYILWEWMCCNSSLSHYYV